MRIGNARHTPSHTPLQTAVYGSYTTLKTIELRHKYATNRGYFIVIGQILFQQSIAKYAANISVLVSMLVISKN